MILALLASQVLAQSGPYDLEQVWRPGTLGALPPPWTAVTNPTEDAVAVLDGQGRVTLIDATSLEVRWQVPLVVGEGRVRGELSFGPGGLAVAAGALDEAVRVAIIDPSDGRITPLGRTPEGARILDLTWLDGETLRTRSREDEPDNPIDLLMERTWGPEPTEREVSAWIPGRRYESPNGGRAFIDVTERGLSRSGGLEIDVRYRVWDDPWDPATARPLKDCPEWSETVHVSDDGRLAYTMGQVRCVYDLDDGEVVAWETKQVPFWSALAPDGQQVVERHGRSGRSYGVIRDTHTGEVISDLPGMREARFTGASTLLVWTDYRLEMVSLADGSKRWGVPLDGDVVDVQVAPNAGSIIVAERVADGGRLRLRILGPDGTARGLVDDVDGIFGFSEGGRRLLVRVRFDALGVVDLRSPGTSGPRTHHAGLRAVQVDDACQIASGDDEGRVRWARGETSRTWTVPGEVVDVRFVGDEVITLTVEEPPDPERGQEPSEEPNRWRVERRAVDGDGPRRPPVVGEGFRGGRITPDGQSVILLGGEEGDVLAPAGRGRTQTLPDWASKGGVRPSPTAFEPDVEGDRLIAVPDTRTADQALAYSFGRVRPAGRYPLKLGRPEVVAVSDRRVAVLSARGGGRVFRREGGGAVDLASVDGGEAACCAGLGGGILAAVFDQDVVFVFDATNGDVVQRLDPGFAARLSAVAVSPRGDCIAVGSEGGELATWKR